VSLQIESKWLGEDSVDGSKIKIKVGQALVAEGSVGDLDLIKVGIDDKAEGPQGILAAESFVLAEVANEASARSSADIDLAGQISTEAATREAADIDLNLSIEAEESARIAEDATFLKLNGTRGMQSTLNMASGSNQPSLMSITSHTPTAVDEAVTISGGGQYVPGQNSYEVYKDGVLIHGSYADGSVFFAENYLTIASGFGFGFFGSVLTFTAHQIGQYSLWLYAPGGLTSYKIINLANGVDAGDAINKGQLDSAISSVLSNVDPAMIDSFTEVVTAFQTADSNLNNAIQALGTGSSSALGEEIQNRVNADNLLSARLDVLETDPTTETYVDGEIATEAAARVLGDSTTLSSAQSYTDAEVLVEKNRAEGIEGQLNMRLMFLEMQTMTLDLKFEVGVNNVATTHVVLPVLANKIYKVCVGRLNVFKDVDFTLGTEMVIMGPGIPGAPGVPVPVTKITWIGDLASGGNSPIANGDKIFVTYLA